MPSSAVRVSVEPSAPVPASVVAPRGAHTHGTFSLVEWLCVGLGIAATVKAASVAYHLRQCQRRERTVRDLVDATEAHMPRLLMPPIIINEADPSGSSTSRAVSTSAAAAANPGSTTIRILSVKDRQPSLIPHNGRAQHEQSRQPNHRSSSSTHRIGGLWHKEEGDALNKNDRLRLENILSRVHLFMQPRWTLSPNMSPACTMLEAFLRLYKIPYTAHIVRVLNNREVIGKARDADVPQEDGGNRSIHADHANTNGAQPVKHATFLGSMANSRGSGVTKSTLQCMDTAAGFALEKIADLDNLHRRLPFIVYQGEVVSGSFDTITAYLMDKFHIPDLAAQADDGSGDQVALAQALRRTLTFTLDMQYKVGLVLEAPHLFARYAAPAMGYSALLMRLWVSLPWFSKLKTDVRRSLRAHDLGALTRDQFHITALRDMEMIESLLRNPHYEPSADDDGTASSHQGHRGQRQRTPSLTPRSVSSGLSNSWGAGHHGGGTDARGRHPSKFLFSHERPSREDCVLYAYLMPVMRLSCADLDSMPSDANDAIRFAHESEVFADFVERMTTRAFPDFDRMICFIMGIDPSQLFMSRYRVPSGGEEAFATTPSVAMVSRGGAAGKPLTAAAAARTKTAGRGPQGVQSTSVYEDSLRAGAASSSLGRLSTGPSVKATPTTTGLSQHPHTSGAEHRVRTAVPSPSQTTTSSPVPSLSGTAVRAAAQTPRPSVPKLVLPAAPSGAGATAARTVPAALHTAQPAAAPAPAPAARPTQQTPRVTRAPPTPTPSVSNRSTAPTTRTAPAAAGTPAVTVPPVVRYTPSNPNASASAIRKTRPVGMSNYSSPRV